jgi:hypothetical protein
MKGRPPSTEKAARERRLRAALRENIKRRKAQARDRALARQGMQGEEHVPPAHDSAGISSENNQD